jgi:drug/metabolite transporter (DMT)-like permease
MSVFTRRYVKFVVLFRIIIEFSIIPVKSFHLFNYPLASAPTTQPSHSGLVDRYPHRVIRPMSITSRLRPESDVTPLLSESAQAPSSSPSSKDTNHQLKPIIQSIEYIQSQPYYWRLVMLGLCMLWATNFAVVKTILQEPGINPAIYAAARFTLAAVAMLPKIISALSNRDLVMRALLIGSCVFIAYFGQSMGMLTSTASKCAFISSMNVVWVALVSGILANKFNLQIWFSVLLSVMGAGFIELQGKSPPVIGDLWLLLQPIGFGTGFMLLERLMKVYPEAAGAVSGFKLLAVSMASISWVVLTGHATSADLMPLIQSPVALVGCLYTGLITTAGGVFIQAHAFKRVTATDASIILSSEPLWAALFASFLLSEDLSMSDLLGGILIICSTLSNEFHLVNQLTDKYAHLMKEKTDLNSFFVNMLPATFLAEKKLTAHAMDIEQTGGSIEEPDVDRGLE